MILTRTQVAALIASAGLAASALGQTVKKPNSGLDGTGGMGAGDDSGFSISPPPSEEVKIDPIDSGLIAADPAGGEQQTVFFAVVHVTDAPWLRLKFDLTQLSGDPANDNAARVKLTSVLDGGVQWLTAESIEQWVNTSAYFNGDTVLVELIASPGTGDNRLVITTVTAGLNKFGDRTICGSADDRQLSFDDRQGRHSVGCTSWLINDGNSMFLTAGHCGTSGGNVMSFKVPLSNPNGSLVNPGPEHQYSTDGASVQFHNNGVGDDYGYFGVNVNSNTGLTPYQAYGMRYVLATTLPNVNQTTRITGYGTTSSPVSPTWNQVQKTHTGPFKFKSGSSIGYHVDTTGGNSGSPVFDETQQKAVGVHTHGGCGSSSSSYNNGTGINNSGLIAALANPLGICKTGKGVAGGDLFVSGDAANNFGTASRTTGAFAKLGDVPGVTQGMAWDWNRNLFYIIDNTKKLYTMTTGGSRMLVGTVTGTGSTLNCLAFDPVSRTLFAVAASGGQLFKIDRDTLVASAIGSPSGGNLGGLDYDTTTGTLYGISDVTIGGTRLVSINTTTGAQTAIGTLGAGITDCNALAYCSAGDELFTINSSNEQLLKVSKSTGVATVVGSTAGLFGASFGMAGANIKACPADFDGSGFSDIEDFSAFVLMFESGLIDGDVDGSGFVDLEDYQTFMEAFELGC
ncbi:MAG: hypothetical protein IT435_13305 [Phycisphaerales bacterium]|nr:hypothetical protein [Phycisphaerales bacterium]